MLPKHPAFCSFRSLAQRGQNTNRNWVKPGGCLPFAFWNDGVGKLCLIKAHFRLKFNRKILLTFKTKFDILILEGQYVNSQFPQ